MENELVYKKNKNTRRLKAVWSIEMADDLNGFYGIYDSPLTRKLLKAGLKIKTRAR
jgi:hypothetical protein